MPAASLQLAPGYVSRIHAHARERASLPDAHLPGGAASRVLTWDNKCSWLLFLLVGGAKVC